MKKKKIWRNFLRHYWEKPFKKILEKSLVKFYDKSGGTSGENLPVGNHWINLCESAWRNPLRNSWEYCCRDICKSSWDTWKNVRSNPLRIFWKNLLKSYWRNLCRNYRKFCAEWSLFRKPWRNSWKNFKNKFSTEMSGKNMVKCRISCFNR